ncbi:hypothetical protein HK098_004043 [Nowakowskiella sp. JEL0407]|nr:hypothetical protein HK098_004043 [Nowakowskiella sp. JEL0407]
MLTELPLSLTPPPSTFDIDFQLNSTPLSLKSFDMKSGVDSIGGKLHPGALSVLPGCSSESLYHLLNNRNNTTAVNKGVIILDIRSFCQFSVSRIKCAYHLNLPSTFLRRKNMQLNQIANSTLCSNSNASAWLNRLRSYSHLVLYDQHSICAGESSDIYLLWRKLESEFASDKLAGKSVPHVMFLVGGINEFERSYKYLIEGESSSASLRSFLSASPQRFSLSATNISGSTTAPAFVENDSGDFFASKPIRDITTSFQDSMIPAFSFKSAASPGGLLARRMRKLDDQISVSAHSNTFKFFESNFTVPTTEVPSQSYQTSSSIDSVTPSTRVDDSDADTEKQFHFRNEVRTYDNMDQNFEEKFKRLEREEHVHMQLGFSAQKASDSFSMSAGLEREYRNRYNNIWPYNKNRVKLSITELTGGDYINASYIAKPSERDVNAYIATQAPIPSTFKDFWQMCWEQDTRIIVMLCKEDESGKSAHTYWPDSRSTPMVFDTLTVNIISEQSIENNFIYIRIFEMNALIPDSNNCRSKIITQIQYREWPDHGTVDVESFLKFWNLTRRLREWAGTLHCCSDNHSDVVCRNGPMVVHCSAGCGRTGTFVALDITLATIKKNTANVWTTDYIYKTIRELKKQRMLMVQSLEQFKFCYEVAIRLSAQLKSCQQAVVDEPRSGTAAVTVNGIFNEKFAMDVMQWLDNEIVNFKVHLR